VADELITVPEAASLDACARDGGLTQVQLEHLHRQAFFIVLGGEARVPPSQLPVARRRELLALASALGVQPVVDLFGLLVDGSATFAPTAAATSYLKGWWVGLDHADGSDLEQLREMAERHGASVAKRLTKTVRFLATRVDGSADQVKARELGIPIVGPDKAEQILEEAVAAASVSGADRAGGSEPAVLWGHTWKSCEKGSA
jgi:DNA polymerase III subunit epsilon